MKTFLRGVRIEYILISALVFISIGFQTDYFFDTDSTWTVATGRYILEHGIPYTNPFSFLKYDMVVQQWLYCVYLALVDRLGYYGYALSVMLFAGLIWLLADLFFKKRGMTKRWSFLLGAFVVFLSHRCYVLSARPQAVTICLLLGTVYLTECFHATGRKCCLYGLPVLSLLEINLHSSLWLFHFWVMVPYFLSSVPALKRRVFADKEAYFSKSQIKEFIMPVSLMIMSLFVNPYGVKGILYVFDSWGKHTFSYISISEIYSLPIKSVDSLLIIGLLMLTLFLAIKHKLSSVSCFMALPLLACMIAVARNIEFMPLVITYLLADTFNTFDDELLERINKRAGVDVRIVSAFFCVVFLIIDLHYLNVSRKNMIEEGREDVAAYIKGHVSLDDRVYTGLVIGGAMEYYGVANIFIDARPELYNQELADGRNPLRDYNLMISGCIPAVSGSDDEDTYAVQETMESFLSYYGFDYLICDLQTDKFLYLYLESDGNTEWKQVYESGNLYVFAKSKTS